MFLPTYNLEVPNSIIILENSKLYSVSAGEHFVIEKTEFDYKLKYINGKRAGDFACYSEIDIYNIFFKDIKYRECSLESFNNLRAFL